MSDLHNYKIAPIKNEKLFEELILDIWKVKLNNTSLDIFGSSGQEQYGIDILGRQQDTLDFIGIQCKVRDKKITKTEIQNEIDKVKKFPQLKINRYIISTTAKKDKDIQIFIENKKIEHEKTGFFTVEIQFWDDIVALLKQVEYQEVFVKYYRDFLVDVKNLGNAVARIIELTVGASRGPWDVSTFTVMIGRTPERGELIEGRVDYYKSSYFIINLNKGRFDTFPIKCYPSDLEDVFEGRDLYTIVDWINNVDLDKLIYSNEVTYSHIWTDEEYENYLRSYVGE